MKFYKNINKYFLVPLLLIAGFITSCKKLIEIPANPSGKLPTTQVFVDSADVMRVMAGVYLNFKATDSYSFSFLNGGITFYTGAASDEMISTNSFNPLELQFNTNTIASSNSNLLTFWQDAYANLYQVNASIEGITASTGLSASLKNQLLGELKVIRAMYYFNLVNIFGKVPLAVSSDYNVNAVLPGASVDAIYTQVIADLTSARKLLNTTYPSAGRSRPNLYVASALLAKVYLYKSQWQNAANMASSLINSGQFGLETDLNNVFMDGSNEAIWQLPAAGNSTQTFEGAKFVPYSNTSVPTYTLTGNLIGAFETGDQRAVSWVGQSTHSGITYHYPFKYKNNNSSGAPVEDYMIFRLGEQYLIRAEALAHVSKLDSALADVNLLRVRAGLAGVPATTVQTTVLTAIMRERRTELFCEWGNRWFDLKRTGTIDAVLGSEKTGWQSTYALFPIPQSEILSNPFLTQNPGYN
jgi:hypothetical protein